MKKMLGRVLFFLAAAGLGPVIAAGFAWANPADPAYPPLSPAKDGRPSAAAHYLSAGEDGKIRLALQVRAPGATIESVRLDNLSGPSSTWRSAWVGDEAAPLTVTHNGQTLADGSRKMSFGPLGEDEEVLELTLADNGAFKEQRTDFRVTVFLAGGARALCLLKIVDQPPPAASLAKTEPQEAPPARPEPPATQKQEAEKAAQARPEPPKDQDSPGFLDRLKAKLKNFNITDYLPSFLSKEKTPPAGPKPPKDQDSPGFLDRLRARLENFNITDHLPSFKKEAPSAQAEPPKDQDSPGWLDRLGARLKNLRPQKGNPFIGAWKLDSAVKDGKKIDPEGPGLPTTLIFTATEFKVTENSDETGGPVQYRRNEDKSWAFSADGDRWLDVKFADKNTLKLELERYGETTTLVFKRIKGDPKPLKKETPSARPEPQAAKDQNAPGWRERLGAKLKNLFPKKGNPFIGAWEFESMVVEGKKLDRESIGRELGANARDLELMLGTITFTETEVKATAQSEEKVLPVQYRRNEDNSWAFSADGNMWLDAKFADKNTLKLEIEGYGGATSFVFKRIKGASKPPKGDSKPPKGGKNPLIGTWKMQNPIQDSMMNKNMAEFGLSADDLMGNQTVTFTSSEAITRNGSNEQRQKVKYRQDSGNIWSVSPDGKNWEGFIIVDRDTLKQELGGMTITLKRVK